MCTLNVIGSLFRYICHGRRLRQCGVTLAQYVHSLRSPHRRFHKKRKHAQEGEWVQSTLPFHKKRKQEPEREAVDLE